MSTRCDLRAMTRTAGQAAAALMPFAILGGLLLLSAP
jgi:hypothetical protein